MKRKKLIKLKEYLKENRRSFRSKSRPKVATDTNTNEESISEFSVDRSERSSSIWVTPRRKTRSQKRSRLRNNAGKKVQGYSLQDAPDEEEEDNEILPLKKKRIIEDEEDNKREEFKYISKKRQIEYKNIKDQQKPLLDPLKDTTETPKKDKSSSEPIKVISDGEIDIDPEELAQYLSQN